MITFYLPALKKFRQFFPNHLSSPTVDIFPFSASSLSYFQIYFSALTVFTGFARFWKKMFILCAKLTEIRDDIETRCLATVATERTAVISNNKKHCGKTLSFLSLNTKATLKRM